MLVFFIYTKKALSLKSLQEKTLAFILKHEKNVIFKTDTDPFDKNSKCLRFLKNEICFMSTAFRGKEHDDDTIETKQYIASKLKLLNENIELNLMKEHLLKSKKCFRFIFSDNLQKIREDHENFVIWMTEFFQEEYDALVIQHVENTKTKEEFVLWNS